MSRERLGYLFCFVLVLVSLAAACHWIVSSDPGDAEEIRAVGAR